MRRQAPLGAARIGRAIVLVLLAPAVLGCGRFNARMELKKGNAKYKEGKFAKAVEFYARVPPEVPERVQAALNTGYAYMADYRFGSKHEKDRAAAQNAVTAYEEFLKIRPEKSGDASLPEVGKVEDWIVTLLVDSERYDDAVARLKKGLESKSNDPALLRGLATTYDKWGKPTVALEYFQKWAKEFPKEPSPAIAIAAYCWNMSYRQSAGMEPLERNRWVDHGIHAAEAGVAIRADSNESMEYKNLLLRERAKLRTDPDEVAQLVRQAADLLAQAKAIRYKRKAEEDAAKAKASPSPASDGKG